MKKHLLPNDFIRKILFLFLVVALALSITAFTQDIPEQTMPSPEILCEETCTYDGIVVWCDHSCGINQYWGAIVRKCCDPCTGCYYTSDVICTNDPWGYCN